MDRESRAAQTDRPRRWAMAVIAAGVVARVAGYAYNRSLWCDEASLADNIVHRTLRELAAPLANEQGAPLGFLAIEKTVTLAFGTSEYALRLFPLVAALVSLPVFLAVARRTLPQRTMLFALALFALADPLVLRGGGEAVFERCHDRLAPDLAGPRDAPARTRSAGVADRRHRRGGRHLDFTSRGVRARRHRCDVHGWRPGPARPGHRRAACRGWSHLVHQFRRLLRRRAHDPDRERLSRAVLAVEVRAAAVGRVVRRRGMARCRKETRRQLGIRHRDAGVDRGGRCAAPIVAPRGSAPAAPRMHRVPCRHRARVSVLGPPDTVSASLRADRPLRRRHDHRRWAQPESPARRDAADAGRPAPGCQSQRLQIDRSGTCVQKHGTRSHGWPQPTSPETSCTSIPARGRTTATTDDDTHCRQMP